MIAGFVMAALGIFYLIFEDFFLSDFSVSRSEKSQPKRLGPERLLVGTQVRATSMLHHWKELTKH
jgi:hypothetical protein